MIRIIVGGKRSSGWVFEGVNEFEKRLKKPFDVKWEIFEEEKLNKRERNILEQRFFDGKTQMEVADEIGISQAQVSRLEKNALDIIKKNIT